MKTNKNITYVSSPVVCAVADVNTGDTYTWTLIKHLLRKIAKHFNDFLNQHQPYEYYYGEYSAI